MNKEQLERLEAQMLQEVAKRRPLGGYSTDASTILMLCETIMRILQHVIEHDSEIVSKKKK